MGANTSAAPRIASMNNPTSPETIILISDEVASRIEGTRQQVDKPPQNPLMQATATPATTPSPSKTEPYICKNCSEKGKEDNKTTKVAIKPPPAPLSPLEQKSKAFEKEEFDRTLQMLDKTIGKPTDWTKEHKVEVKKLQSDLLQCYKDYPKEPLRCHNNAKEYQDFVFEKQYKTILKQTLGAGDSNEK